MRRDEIVVLANDVVPGMGLPVAAPGLRAWGLAQGLRAHGHDVTLVVDAHVVSRAWPRAFPPPRRQTLVLTPQQTGDYVRSRRPEALVVTNSNHVAAVGAIPGTRLVYDFFAAKLLELAEHAPGPERDRESALLTERKLNALARADAVLVNGSKKLGYVDSWLERAGTPDTPRSVVIMPVPTMTPSPTPTDGPLHAVVSGYIQPWSQPGEWIEALTPAILDGRLVLHLLVSRHWGGRGATLEVPAGIQRLAELPGVRAHGSMEFEPFQRLLNQCHLSIDLFAPNAERELAMVTRTMVAIASGLATVHVPFTETSDLVREFDAGWLVAPDDLDSIAAVFQDAVSDRDLVVRKRTGAEALASQLAPAVAVAPLIDLLKGLRS